MKIRQTLIILLAFVTCLQAWAQTSLRAGKDYAVFFYVTKFQPGWPALPETETEAKALKAELESNYGFTCKLVPNPTKQQIREELASWNNRLGPDDQVLYFFSMHGFYRPASDLGYLVAADGKYEDRYSESYLNYNDLRPYFSECKARHILVALDACYSGSFGTTRERARPDAPDYAQAPDCAAQLNNALRYSGRQYLCSGNKDARTPAKSAFAAKFLEALRKGPSADGLLFFDDLTYWLGKVRNPEPENGAFAGHEPAGDFVFVRNNACAPAPDRDGDGVPDATDQCPDTWGSQANGCPPDIQADNTAADLAAWKSAKQQNTEAAYRAYLRQFPQGEFKDLANSSLRQFEAEAARQRDNTAWEVAVEKNTAEGYKKYLADFPVGLHRSEADAKLKAVEKPDNMVFIQGGTFQMGSNDGESDEKPVHSVTVGDFYIGKYEVTQGQWRGVMGIDPPYLHNKGCDQCPVDRVSWDDVQEFIKKLNQQTGLKYRLPTEAEWEYAARGGNQNSNYQYAGSNSIDAVAWYSSNYKTTNAFGDQKTTSPVGSKLPNDLGLHDMSGNVNEWCSDWYGSDYYKNSPSSNPTGPTSGSKRVQRGGAWNVSPRQCRVANRDYYTPNNRDLYLGFRLAR